MRTCIRGGCDTNSCCLQSFKCYLVPVGGRLVTHIKLWAWPDRSQFQDLRPEIARPNFYVPGNLSANNLIYSVTCLSNSFVSHIIMTRSLTTAYSFLHFLQQPLEPKVITQILEWRIERRTSKKISKVKRRQAALQRANFQWSFAAY